MKTSQCLLIAMLMACFGCADNRKEKVHNNTENVTGVTWPAINSAVAKNEAIEVRVDAILEQMSQEQKVGQIMQPELRHITPEDIKKYHLGSVLNGGGAFPGDNQYAKPGDWVALADTFYNASMDAAISEEELRDIHAAGYFSATPPETLIIR